MSWQKRWDSIAVKYKRKICVECGADIKHKKCGARFCSDACRVRTRYWRKRALKSKKAEARQRHLTRLSNKLGISMVEARKILAQESQHRAYRGRTSYQRKLCRIYGIRLAEARIMEARLLAAGNNDAGV